MKKIAIICALSFVFSPAYADVTLIADDSSGLMKIHVTHWIKKSEGSSNNPFTIHTEAIFFYLVRKGKTEMIVPAFINSSSENNEIFATAWVSETILADIIVQIS